MSAVSGIANLAFSWAAGGLGFGEIAKLYLQAVMGDVGFFLGNVINVIVFMVKGWVLVFVMMWVRWTLPRLRIDSSDDRRASSICLPISCALLFFGRECVAASHSGCRAGLVRLWLVGRVRGIRGNGGQQWFTWASALRGRQWPVCGG